MMRRIKIFCILLIGLYIQIYGQENEVVVDLFSAALFNSVNSEDVDYNDFTLTIINIDTSTLKNSNLVEKNGYATSQLQNKFEDKVSYSICNSGKNKRKKILTFLLETKNEKKYEIRLLFFKNTVNVHKIPQDSIITYGVLDYAPLLVSKFHISDDYSIRDKKSKILIEYPSLRALSIHLKRLNIGEYLFFDGSKLLFEFEVIPPNNIGNEKN